MATTHAFLGLLLALGVSLSAPDLLVPAAVAGFAGGLFPDLDLAFDHRKTLHFPAYYSVGAVGAAAVAVAAPGPGTVAAAVFLAAAALHSVSDAAGGGLELKPWEGTSDRAVYVHPTGTWVAPRRWVRYDGSPEDFALGAVLAAPSLLAFDGTARLLVAATLALSLVYTAFRKPLVKYAPERFT